MAKLSPNGDGELATSRPAPAPGSADEGWADPHTWLGPHLPLVFCGSGQQHPRGRVRTACPTCRGADAALSAREVGPLAAVIAAMALLQPSEFLFPWRLPRHWATVTLMMTPSDLRCDGEPQTRVAGALRSRRGAPTTHPSFLRDRPDWSV